MAELPKLTTKSGKEGPDLNRIVREVVAEVIEERGWKEAHAAREWKLAQRTLNRFMNGGATNLKVLSTICAELDADPLDFIGAHPGYKQRSGPRLVFSRDAFYDRFRQVLGDEELERVLSSIEEQKRLRIFDECMDAMNVLVRIAKRARRFALAEKPPEQAT